MKHSIFAVPALLLATSSAFAGTGSATFNVGMEVKPSCNISVYQPPTTYQVTVDDKPDYINLDTLLPIKCTAGTQYTVETNADESGYIAFADDFGIVVWQDVGMTKKFGTKAHGMEFAATSNGGNNEYIPSLIEFKYPSNGTLPRVGTYSADIVYTVTF